MEKNQTDCKHPLAYLVNQANEQPSLEGIAARLERCIYAEETTLDIVKGQIWQIIAELRAFAKWRDLSI